MAEIGSLLQQWQHTASMTDTGRLDYPMITNECIVESDVMSHYRLCYYNVMSSLEC